MMNLSVCFMVSIDAEAMSFFFLRYESELVEYQQTDAYKQYIGNCTMYITSFLN